MTSHVNLLFLNVNTLGHRLDELSAVLASAGLPLPPSFPRLFAFVETGRGRCRSLPSYAWVSVDGPDSNGHGGCALYYHESFAVTLLPSSRTFEPLPFKPHHTRSTSILWCRVRPPGPGNSTFLLAVAYVPPQNNTDSNHSMQDIANSILTVTAANPGLPLLVVGDFNARHPDWGDDNGGHNLNSGSRYLARFLDHQGFHILNNLYLFGEPTHWNPQHQSVIDLAFTNDPSMVLDLAMDWKDQLHSDHHPLTVTLRYTHNQPLLPPPDRCRLQWRHLSHPDVWQAALPDAMAAAFSPLLPRFLSLRQPIPPGVSAQSIIGRLYRQFERTFLLVCQQVVGIKPATNRILSNPWWPLAVPSVFLAYKDARRHHAHCRSAASLAAYRAQRATWRAAVRQAKANSWAELCDRVNQSDANKRWAAIARSRSSSFALLASIPDTHGNLPVDLPSSLNNLCAAFVAESLPPPAPGPVATQLLQRLQQWTAPSNSTLPSHPSDQWTFTTTEVAEQCRRQHVHSAPGADSILPSFLRHAGRKVHAILSLLFNFSWRHSVLPQSWTEANVMALYKGAADAAKGKPAGSRASASSYRPISMTSIVIRTLEHLIHRRLTTELEGRGFFSPLQFGFRANHTTADAINLLLSTIRRICREDLYYTDSQGKAAHHKMPCPVVFLDIKKAFDRVWHPQLLSSLHDASITGLAWRWISAFLSRRRIRTVQLTTCSHWHSIHYGVPQGSVLSPLLFLIFINPVLVRIIQQCPRVCPIAFADDGTLAPAVIDHNPIAIAVENHRRAVRHLPPISIVEQRFHLDLYMVELKKALAILDDWCEDSRVRFGADKTKLVVFCGAQGNVDMSPFTSLTLCGFTISVATHYTYLGVILHHKLSWELHVSTALSAARRLSSHITRLTMGATAAHFPSVRTLVLCLLLPSFAYGIAFWGRDLSESSFRRFNSALTQPLRRCLSLPATTHQTGVLVEANCPSVRAWMQRELLLFYYRINSLPLDHPSKQIHLLDTTLRLQSVGRAHLILEQQKYVSTSRHAQLLLLPTLCKSLGPFIQQHSPLNHSIRSALVPTPPLRPDGSDPLAYLSCLEPTNNRRRELQQHLNPAGHLQEVEQWSSSALNSLDPLTIRKLAMWTTHHEWRHPTDAVHQTNAPLLLCKPYPRSSHFLPLDPLPVSRCRSRFRARRAFTGEHHRQLEDKTASAACPFPACQTRLPQPPDETVEHVLLDCPRYSTFRKSLLAALRAATKPHFVLTLPFILGEAFDTERLSKSAAIRYSSLLQLSAMFLHAIDEVRRAAHLIAFKPP